MWSAPARTTRAHCVISDRYSTRCRLPHLSLVRDWTIVTVYCTAPRNATGIDFSGYRINLRVLYCRHHGQPVLQICAVNTTLAANKTTDCFQAGSGRVQDTTVWNPGIPIRDHQPCRTLRSTSALLLQQPSAAIALASNLGRFV